MSISRFLAPGSQLVHILSILSSGRLVLRRDLGNGTGIPAGIENVIRTRPRMGYIPAIVGCGCGSGTGVGVGMGVGTATTRPTPSLSELLNRVAVVWCCRVVSCGAVASAALLLSLVVTSPKRKVPRTSRPYKTGVPEQHSSSVNFTLIVLWRVKMGCGHGEHRRMETAPARDTWGGGHSLASCAPSHVNGVACLRAPFCTNGEGPGVACPPFLRVWGGVPACNTLPRKWGRAGGGVPSRTPFPHVQGGVPACTPLPHIWGRAGGGVPSRTTFLRIWGGVPMCNTLPHEWGRVGWGVACLHVPCAYMAAWPRGKGGPGGWRALAPFPCERGGAKREGEGGAGDAERWGGAFVRPPSEGHGMPSRVPFVHPREWGRHGQGEEEGPAAAAGPVRTPSAQMEGRGWGWWAFACPLTGHMGWHALVHPPFCANGEWWGRGWRALTCPLWWRGQGKGEAEGNGERPSCALPHEWGRGWDTWDGQGGRGGTGGGVPLCAPLPREWDREGEGGGALPLYAPSVRMGATDRGREGGGEGRGRKRAGRRPLPPHRAQRGAHEDKGHTMPATPRPPGPSLLPSALPCLRGRGRTRACRRCHPFPCSRHPIRAESGCTRARCPSPSLLRHPVCAERGHATPWPLLSPFAQKGGAQGHSAPPTLSQPRPSVQPHSHRQGACKGTPPHHTESALPHSRGMGACEGKTCGKGTHEGTRPPSPSLPHSRGRVSHAGTPPRTHGKGGHATPGPSPFARKGARGHATPFTREGVHKAKPCPPPHASWAGVVSMHPRSPRPHPVFTCHSTT
ncbi:hypothetical protein EDB89DRAFT_1915365 [Lactarius sanguifluus]|nr:hypothetical protein EDB89DRAFT_1915365 [Lactarius sanguifluus]